MNATFVSHFSGWQIVYSAFALYANYQVFKWVFNAVKTIATSNFLNAFIYKITPNSVHEMRKAKHLHAQKQKVIEDKRHKEKDYQDALEIHRKYQYTGWWNIGFIEEDRATLFKGFEDIKWQWGSQKIDRTKSYTPDDSRRLAFMIFQEQAIYRWRLIELGKWTPEMEVFWNKILPPQFRPKNKTPESYFKDQLKNAIQDFEDDKPTKASA